jgi:hypothetical protein
MVRVGVFTTRTAAAKRGAKAMPCSTTASPSDADA